MENSEPIPEPSKNPSGLHAKYQIREFSHYRIKPGFFNIEVPVYKNVKPESEYFVLRLDDKATDQVHVAACRRAVLYYAELIKDHIPQLSKDLIERYNLTKP